MPRRPQPETVCYGCGIRFTPKYPPMRGRDPQKRFHNQSCAARYHLRMAGPDELERRRQRGRAQQSVTLAARTQERWSRVARRLVRTALIDVRADLTVADCEPLIRALVMELRRNYMLGYRVAHLKIARQEKRAAA